MNILRVFPRRTNATPTDDMAFIGDPPLPAFRPEADEVHVSCTFTWDKQEAARLVQAWGLYYPIVRVGGPAFYAIGDEFVLGRYVKEGMVMTSRGCPNNCEFCFVPQREGKLRLLEIKAGWDILDNNLLACPRDHIEAVLDMLAEQSQKARFTGGLQASRIEPWFAGRLGKMRLDILYTAYDRNGQEDGVERAVRLLRNAGLRQRQVGCYVLVGQEWDTLGDAKERCEWVKEIGAMPFAMYHQDRNSNGKIPKDWGDFVRSWSRPAAIFAKDRK